ncbi:hypothetical protein E3N88_32222 [Mikania micrantha]|uniref:Reverse transcriptase domain-containing protein n=1 Tax=Mikania micrantha TaxID=192012 RepID=A0A5N6M8K1_9ASTR|nr:hypothetical protein E3N88_32222 [Mikania micrantha]
MPHLRSHGPPPELSLPLRSDSRDFSEGSTSEVSASTSVSADFSEHTPPSSSSSSTHSIPHDALWAFRMAYKTPLGTTPYMVVYGKACHLPVELEHGALWALKTVNLDLTEAGRKRYFQIHELEALHDAVYARSLSIKEKTKSLHDRKLKGLKEFKKGDRVLLYNSRLKLFGGKLKSKWTGPYVVEEVFPYGTVELQNEVDGNTWKVNGHRLKHYIGGPIDENEEGEEILLEKPE